MGKIVWFLLYSQEHSLLTTTSTWKLILKKANKIVYFHVRVPKLIINSWCNLCLTIFIVCFSPRKDYYLILTTFFFKRTFTNSKIIKIKLTTVVSRLISDFRKHQILLTVKFKFISASLFWLRRKKRLLSFYAVIFSIAVLSGFQPLFKLEAFWTSIGCFRSKHDIVTFSENIYLKKKNTRTQPYDDFLLKYCILCEGKKLSSGSENKFSWFYEHYNNGIPKELSMYILTVSFLGSILSDRWSLPHLSEATDRFVVSFTHLLGSFYINTQDHTNLNLFYILLALLEHTSY